MIGFRALAPGKAARTVGKRARGRDNAPRSSGKRGGRRAGPGARSRGRARDLHASALGFVRRCRRLVGRPFAGLRAYRGWEFVSRDARLRRFVAALPLEAQKAASFGHLPATFSTKLGPGVSRVVYETCELAHETFRRPNTSGPRARSHANGLGGAPAPWRACLRRLTRRGPSSAASGQCPPVFRLGALASIGLRRIAMRRAMRSRLETTARTIRPLGVPSVERRAGLLIAFEHRHVSESLRSTGGALVDDEVREADHRAANGIAERRLNALRPRFREGDAFDLREDIDASLTEAAHHARAIRLAGARPALPRLRNGGALLDCFTCPRLPIEPQPIELTRGAQPGRVAWLTRSRRPTKWTWPFGRRPRHASASKA